MRLCFKDYNVSQHGPPGNDNIDGCKIGGHNGAG